MSLFASALNVKGDKDRPSFPVPADCVFASSNTFFVTWRSVIGPSVIVLGRTVITSFPGTPTLKEIDVIRRGCAAWHLSEMMTGVFVDGKPAARYISATSTKLWPRSPIGRKNWW